MDVETTSLDALHDIVEPDLVPWWPLAPGWYVVALTVALTLLWLLLRAISTWQRNRYRREALRELATVSATDLPTLVKRVCLAAWPRSEVASLCGEPWLAFLDASDPTSSFTTGPGRSLATLSYQPQISKQEFAALKVVVGRWIQNHPISNEAH